MNQTSGLSGAYTFDNFVVGASNRLAYTSAIKVADQPGAFANPLYIFGDVGLGKTHLMQCIGNYILENDLNKKVLYVKTDQFIEDYGQAAQKKLFDDFSKKYENVDILLVDDIQFLSGKSQTQLEFFKIFERLKEANKQIVITSDRSGDRSLRHHEPADVPLRMGPLRRHQQTQPRPPHPDSEEEAPGGDVQSGSDSRRRPRIHRLDLREQRARARRRAQARALLLYRVRLPLHDRERGRSAQEPDQFERHLEQERQHRELFDGPRRRERVLPDHDDRSAFDQAQPPVRLSQTSLDVHLERAVRPHLQEDRPDLQQPRPLHRHLFDRADFERHPDRQGEKRTTWTS
ncbi:MAG: DnaA/Hda family protein [Bacillus subtilis]|nr:DnaA/Hda family protein [Bacillus subtilis]